MIVLDTNVLSELLRPAPAPAVVDWVAARPTTSLFTTAVTQAEVLFGLRLLPEGQRRARLEAAVGEIFAVDFSGRILPFDGSAADAYADIAAACRRGGRPIAQLDAQIAAIARSRDAAVATRNVADFEPSGIVLHDPWQTDG